MTRQGAFSRDRWRQAGALVLGLAMVSAAPAVGQELTLRPVGNAGVVITDGTTSLLVDLPHEPGAFGYASYEPGALNPPGDVVSVITHAHRDHFAPELFLDREDWRVVGPSGLLEVVPRDRSLGEDVVAVGAFTITAIPTPHTEGHRSYSIAWKGRSLHVTGDTEDPQAALTGPRHDVLITTPWLSCAIQDSGRVPNADRTILVHRRPDNADRICGPSEVLPPGTVLRLPAVGMGPGEPEP